MDLLSQASLMDEASGLGSSLAFTGSGEVSKLPGASGVMYKGKTHPIEYTEGAQQSKMSSEIALAFPITVAEDIKYFEGGRACEPPLWLHGPGSLGLEGRIRHPCPSASAP